MSWEPRRRGSWMASAASSLVDVGVGELGTLALKCPGTDPDGGIRQHVGNALVHMRIVGRLLHRPPGATAHSYRSGITPS